VNEEIKKPQYNTTQLDLQRQCNLLNYINQCWACLPRNTIIYWDLFGALENLRTELNYYIKEEDKIVISKLEIEISHILNHIIYLQNEIRKHKNMFENALGIQLGKIHFKLKNYHQILMDVRAEAGLTSGGF